MELVKAIAPLLVAALTTVAIWEAAAAATAPLPVPPARAHASADVTPCPTVPVTASSDTPAFDARRAYEHVDELSSDIGIRPAGSQRATEAAAYVAGMLESYGYSVQGQPFTYLYSGDAGSTLTMSRPQAPNLPVLPLVYSCSGRVAGPLVNAGYGRQGDFAGTSWRGKIALAKRMDEQYFEIVQNAGEAGAAAVIIYNSQPGLAHFRLAEVSDIPAVTVSGETGQFLLEALRSGPVEVQLSVNTVTETRTAQNIIARWPGSGPTTLIVGAHYDSAPSGPGANDNASGVAVMIESARVLAGTDGVTFVAFGSEELGLWGSKSYANSISAADMSSLTGMLNLDQLGAGDRVLAIDRFGNESIQLQKQALEVAAELGVPATGDIKPRGSDHFSFGMRGVPSVQFWTGKDPHNHSSEDTKARVSPSSLGAAGRIVVELANRMLRP